jgi:hypothetical protein
MENNEAVEILEKLMLAVKTITNKAEEGTHSDFALKNYEALIAEQKRRIDDLIAYKNYYFSIGTLVNTELCHNCNSVGTVYWTTEDGNKSDYCPICEGRGFLYKD